MAIDLRQTCWRFGFDNGSTEANYTLKGAENAVVPLRAGGIYILRIGVQEAGGTAAANLAQQFQVQRNALGWNDITTVSAVVKAIAVASFADADASTKRLTTLTGDPDTSNRNCTEDGSSGGSFNDVPASGHSETVLGFQVVAADVADGDTLYFRVTVSGPTTSITYTVTPSATVYTSQTLAATQGTTADLPKIKFTPQLHATVGTTATNTKLFARTIAGTMEGRGFLEIIGSHVRVKCIATLEYEIPGEGPSEETLAAESTSTAGLVFPPKLDATWSAFDKVQTTYHLPWVAKTQDATTAPVAVLAERRLTHRLDATVETTANIAERRLTHLLAATAGSTATVAERRLTHLLAATAEFVADLVYRLPWVAKLLDVAYEATADIARTVSAWRTLPAEEPTDAVLRFPPKLDALAETTATVGVRSLFQNLEAVAETTALVSERRLTHRLEATHEPIADLQRRAFLAVSLELAAAGSTARLAPNRFPLDTQAATAAGLAVFVFAARPLDATTAATATLRFPPILDAEAATTAGIAERLLTPHLAATEEPTAELARVVSASVPLAAEEAATAGLFSPQAAVIELENEAATVADLARVVLAFRALSGEAPAAGDTSAWTPGIQQLDGTVTTTATLTPQVVAFRALDATEQADAATAETHTGGVVPSVSRPEPMVGGGAVFFGFPPTILEPERPKPVPVILTAEAVVESPASYVVATGEIRLSAIVTQSGTKPSGAVGRAVVCLTGKAYPASAESVAQAKAVVDDTVLLIMAGAI